MWNVECGMWNVECRLEAEGLSFEVRGWVWVYSWVVLLYRVGQRTTVEQTGLQLKLGVYY